MLKEYICVLNQVPDHMVPVLVAHSVLRADDKFFNNVSYMEWYAGSFKKVVLSVNEKEFDKIIQLSDICISHENSTLDGKPSCIVICPREEYPNVIKFAKMWKPK